MSETIQKTVAKNMQNQFSEEICKKKQRKRILNFNDKWKEAN